MESQRPWGVEVKRSKVREGNGRGEGAGTGWDQREGDRGRAEEAGQLSGGRMEAQQVQAHLRRAGIPRVPGLSGPASPIASTPAVSVSRVQIHSVLLQR